MPDETPSNSASVASATPAQPAPAAAPAPAPAAAEAPKPTEKPADNSSQPDPMAAFNKAWAEFKAPEGFDAEAVKEIADFAKKSGFPPGTVALLAAREKARAEAEDAQYKHLSEKGWLEELQKDPQLGGEKVRETMVNVMRAHDRLSPEIQALIKEQGVLYNPVVVRLLHDIGTRMKEDTFVRPGASPSPATKTSPDEALMRLFETKKG